jgi:hypothetical protein
MPPTGPSTLIWNVGPRRYALRPHIPITDNLPDISFATETGHLHLLRRGFS